MIFERQKKNKKAQTINVVIKLVVGLVVVGILIYIGYKYILGTGESVGGLAQCSGQGGKCGLSCGTDEKSFPGMGCPEKGDAATARVCCIKSSILTK